MRYKLKHGAFLALFFLFVILSVYFLLPDGDIDHEQGDVSAELTQVETTEGNITRISYVNEAGEIRDAIDKHYATLVRVRDSEGQLLKEYYLDAEEEPAECNGYFGISYEHGAGENLIITYLDAEGKPTRSNSGYAVTVRSLNAKGQIVDDMYYDADRNPVMCTGGYYGVHREYDTKGHNSKIVYLNVDRSPMCGLGGYAEEKRQFDEEGRVIQKFFFDEEENPVCLQMGQAGEAYTYDEYNRIEQTIYLDKEGNPTAVTDGYTILRRTYYRDGTEKTNQYFDASGNPVSLTKGKYGIERIGNISLYLNRNGRVKLSIDNLLNGYPFMVVVVGILLCLLFCVLPPKLQKYVLLLYLIFIFYETLMFRETGDTRANLILFSYASAFLSNWKIRADAINNVWLFVPFGTGMYAVTRKKKVWVTALILSAAIELIQYFTGLGIAELDDLFGNTLGGAIGVGVGIAVFRIKTKIRR